MTNHIGILKDLKAGKTVTLKSENVALFKQSFELFTGTLIEYTETEKDTFRINLIH